MMDTYEEILRLRKELKRPGMFQHHQIQLRMSLWGITIRGSLAFKRLMDIILSVQQTSLFRFF